ncbi:hypothetical protein [Nocardia wallacei]|uniref:Uncharacterized protein n=1 Tax=Nocardia wallacei TaxID=480035 RepID=A0A7G1KM25_9NOCA|nr:hypothetical protein [Nocardia wallacei]BCK55881.1 hypothetical protein NWFMUON74_36530 [Nocardia wallacei]
MNMISRRAAPTPASSATVGFLVLIPALVFIGPVAAALLLRYHHAETAASTALLTATLAATAALLAVAITAFAVAWRSSRARRTAPVRRSNTLTANRIGMGRPL